MRNLLIALLCVTAFSDIGVAMAGESAEVPGAVIPLPETISPEARQQLSRFAVSRIRSLSEQTAVGQSREAASSMQKMVSAKQLKRYPVDISESAVAGVPVRVLAPRDLPVANKRHVLINIHGGGFVVDSGSLSENIPLAWLTKTKVIAVLYPLSPEHQFPAAVDAVIAVYREVLRNHRPSDIVLYGTSAGAVLTAEVAVRLKALDLPMPAALGFFSGSADLSRRGFSEYDPSIPDAGHTMEHAIAQYAGGHDLAGPMISPLFADLRGLPPTLLMSGTRDLLLSQTTIFHRVLIKAGVSAELVVFEAMPHAHWSYLDMPESDEAFGIMAGFFSRHLGGKG
jgi:acetyl esterase/lipase